jgi:outer membrane receptor for ferrienterochelin and colicins
MRKIYTTGFIILSVLTVSAQEDSSKIRQMDEVIITATRTERKLGNVAVPVQLINGKTIQQSGSLRLTDILQEQTGLFITSGGTANTPGGGIFGNGVQVQGLSPDYTLILLDGEPVIGRNGGVLDLSRLAVANIKKIEIVKGPSSSLYGSEAMGGVINIITDQPKQDRLDAGIRYGRFNTVDANLTAAIRKENFGIQFFGNRNSAGGYDLDKTITGNTVDPWKNYTGQVRFFYQPAAKTKISLSARYFNEIQSNFLQVTDPSSGMAADISGDERIKDININPVITQQFSDNIRSSLRLYFSRYQFEQRLVMQPDKAPYYHDFFQQDFYRAEDQTDIRVGEKHTLIAGGGVIFQRLNTTRYNGIKHSSILYGFVQDEWKATEKLLVIGGFRYDDNSDYAAAWSPKLAMQYKINDKLRVNASYGAGFKAPDFRQLYLNFTNHAAGDYTIYGANEVTIQALEQQKQQGIITEILPRAYQLSQLNPEISKGLNAGFHYDVTDRFNINVNLFRNDIDNLIIVDVVAHKNNGADVYSYFNVKKAFTEGSELQLQYSLSKKWQLAGGYQFLITADKNDLQRVKNGVYTRDWQTGQVRLINRSEYAGLPNRSGHMANLKLFYEDAASGWSASLRGIYRSRWGITDNDGDGIIDQDNEFARGFLLANISAAKIIKKFRLQAGIDNFLNYKDRKNLPGLPGLQPYISIMYSFIKKSK